MIYPEICENCEKTYDICTCYLSYSVWIDGEWVAREDITWPDDIASYSFYQMEYDD